ncbi:hypothetical protein BH10PSE18_BH10PSE18_49700 [soil metagenome]
MMALIGPARIDAVQPPGVGTGLIGMTHCPGRQGLDGRGRLWARDLDADLAAVRGWGAAHVLTLLPLEELARLGVAGLPGAVAEAGMAWAHLPIADFEPPGEAARRAWPTLAPGLREALQKGERVLIHCAAGLGRTGTVAGMLLIELGVLPAEAIAQIRQARPGTIETQGQLDFVLQFGAG